MNKELMLCPFCGSVPLVNIIEPHKHSWAEMPDHPGSCVIECGCGAGLIDDTQELVSNRWNTRAEKSIDPAQLEKAPDTVHQTLISSPDGFWRDCDKDTLKFNADSGWLTRTLFTSPPEVAELQKQVQALQVETADYKTGWHDDARLYASLLQRKLPRNMLLALAFAEDYDGLKAENARLQTIIDSRPAINAGLPETYINWSRSIYAIDMCQGETKQ